MNVFDPKPNNTRVRIEFDDGKHTEFLTVAELYKLEEKIRNARRLLEGYVGPEGYRDDE